MFIDHSKEKHEWFSEEGWYNGNIRPKKSQNFGVKQVSRGKMEQDVIFVEKEKH